MLILIDQFEEVFSQIAAQSERTLLLELIVAFSAKPHPNLFLVVTIRPDFLEQCANFPKLADAIPVCAVKLGDWVRRGWIHARRTPAQRLWVLWADEAEVKRVKALCERLIERALAMDGTCTGEHGVGQGKMKYLAGELGSPALAAMAAIKRALDPDDIMNPGKIVALT